MMIAELCEQRMREAEKAWTDALDRDFAESLKLPIEEVFRRNNIALGELLGVGGGRETRT